MGQDKDKKIEQPDFDKIDEFGKSHVATNLRLSQEPMGGNDIKQYLNSNPLAEFGEPVGEEEHSEQEAFPGESENMISLRHILNLYDHALDIEDEQNRQVIEYTKLALKLKDKDEILVALYYCVSKFALGDLFQKIVVKNNKTFKVDQPKWYLLFTEQNIFKKLSK